MKTETELYFSWSLTHSQILNEFVFVHKQTQALYDYGNASIVRIAH